ncbi:MAG: hypothetical protein U0640_03505 [Phycisphaerales bacterium]
MGHSIPVRYAIASCWHKSFEEVVPYVPLGPFDSTMILERIPKDASFDMWALEPRCKSRELLIRSLWIVLELQDGKIDLSADDITYASANVIWRGHPRGVCDWLLARGLPVPADDTHDILIGVNTETVSQRRGLVIGARYGNARSGFMGVAVSSMGEAHVGQRGIAIAQTSGKAVADESGVAIAQHWGRACAADRGIAIATDEFTHADAGNNACALSGFGGTAIVRNNSVAIVNQGTAQGGHGSVLVFRTSRGLVVGRIGENGLLPNIPYHVERGVIVAGEWDVDTASSQDTPSDES